jgi:hypothetical protein
MIQSITFSVCINTLFESEKFKNVFINACKNGNAELVNVLLMLDFVDPTSYITEAFNLASKNGHIAVVERLLQLNIVWDWSKVHGFREFREFRDFQAFREFDKDEIGNDPKNAINLASKYGHIAVVNRLLQEVRNNKSLYIEYDYAICIASKYGHINIVDRLLQDGMDWSHVTQNIFLISLRFATIQGNMYIVDRLLQDMKLLEIPFNYYEYMPLAISNWHYNILDLLYEYKLSTIGDI